MATVQITWKEPPAEAFPRSHKELVVAELKKRAGDWGLVQQGMKSNTSVHTWKKLGCESVAAPGEKDAKLWDVYARWPEAKQEAAAAARPKTVADVPARALKPPAAVKPAKATLPLTTRKPADTALDPDDPHDADLLRQRQRFEADRAARLAGNKPGR